MQKQPTSAGKIQRLLASMNRLQTLVLILGYADSVVDGAVGYRHFSDPMLQVLKEHRTLTGIEITFCDLLRLQSVKIFVSSLPESIETLKISDGSLGYGYHYQFDAEVPSAAALAAEVADFRAEPYPKLRHFVWTSRPDAMLIGTILFLLLRICPQLEVLDLPHLPFPIEQEVTSVLFECCPNVSALDIDSWKSINKFRLMQRYALRSLRACELYSDRNGEPSFNQYAVIPSLLTLSKFSLRSLNLQKCGLRVPHHDIPYLLKEFPNLQDLSISWFDFLSDMHRKPCSDDADYSKEEQKKDGVDRWKWPASPHLKILSIDVYENCDVSCHFLDELPSPVIPVTFAPMTATTTSLFIAPSSTPPPSHPRVSTPIPIPGSSLSGDGQEEEGSEDMGPAQDVVSEEPVTQQNVHEVDEGDAYDGGLDNEEAWDHYDPLDDYNGHTEKELDPRDLDLSIPYKPPAKRQTSARLAPAILRLYDNLTRLKNLRDLQISWCLGGHTRWLYSKARRITI
ncbi:hypothetical protein EMPS_05003 [Entomortierella parvispora]|uniref:Uncharacterized protein n=1 Tax=Entomortierella parvispora TaxID=205924 RepID=A0A9P3H9L6_9FUNG|nr:hypothetical protein EMPS_05003 [Entomortierella parvispora]